jgi:hypothetical protein
MMFHVIASSAVSHHHRPPPRASPPAKDIAHVRVTGSTEYCADAGRLPELTDMPASDSVESLVLDLLEWMSGEPRPYAEVLEAWRTSCPRLPVWEEANDRGFIRRHRSTEDGALVSISAAGAHYLRMHRRPSP